jgi:hypothetical protein
MEDITFHIITPYKGPEEWLKECVHSVKIQTLSSVHHVIIDHDNKGACRNHFEALQKIDPSPNNIIIHLDGDDKFINHRALEVIKQAYLNPSIWVTYGNYVSRQGSVCRPLVQEPFRASMLTKGWRWSHPRTFRASLIPHLKESDMKDFQGNWLSSAADVAIFLPMLELAGNNRIKFIDEDLIYYRIHQNNDHASQEKLHDQMRCVITICQKLPYGEL